MRAQIGVVPPRPPDDVEHPAVGVVLVLQASSHHLVGVGRDHGEDLRQRRHRDVLQRVLWTKAGTRKLMSHIVGWWMLETVKVRLRQIER